jgi:hypothetical protein
VLGHAAEEPFTRPSPERAHDEKANIGTACHFGELLIWHARGRFLFNTRTHLSQSDRVIVEPVPDRS